MVGGGGVIRDHNGVCVSGFARAIGIATSVEAELWALRDGLNICLAKNLKLLNYNYMLKLSWNGSLHRNKRIFKQAEPNNNLVGGGGVIRDHNGVCVSGFARAIGIATSVEAELWALRDGLNICLAKNLKLLNYNYMLKLSWNGYLVSIALTSPILFSSPIAGT
nr:hypothetical protein CFP56_42720 [Quercus suber]